MKTATMIIITVLLFCEVCFGGYGQLYIYNTTTSEGIEEGYTLLCRYPDNCTDGYDAGIDEIIDWNDWQTRPFLMSYSRIPNYNLTFDVRPDDDTPDIYEIDLVINDVTPQTRDNTLIIDMSGDYTEAFGEDYMVYLRSSRLLWGQYVNLKKLVENNDPYNQPDCYWPHIHLAAIGQFEPRFPAAYETLRVYICKNEQRYFTCVCDLNEDNDVDDTDFAVLAAGWLCPQGKYRADISSSAEGVPDGYVDNYDLAMMIKGLVNQN